MQRSALRDLEQAAALLGGIVNPYGEFAVPPRARWGVNPLLRRRGAHHVLINPNINSVDRLAVYDDLVSASRIWFARPLLAVGVTGFLGSLFHRHQSGSDAMMIFVVIFAGVMALGSMLMMELRVMLNSAYLDTYAFLPLPDPAWVRMQALMDDNFAMMNALCMDVWDVLESNRNDRHAAKAEAMRVLDRYTGGTRSETPEPCKRS